MASEQSYLLPVRSGESDDSGFEALGPRRDSFSQMKVVVHNDPLVRKHYTSVEDFGKLLGSTSVLMNALDQNNESKKPARRRIEIGQQPDDATFQTAPPVAESLRSTPNGSGGSYQHRPTNSIGGGSVGGMRNSGRGGGGGKYDSNKVVLSRMDMLYKSHKNTSTLYLKKIKTSFFHDAKSLAEGTIPQSMVLAVIIGIVCGVACYLYYSVLYFGLDYIWNVLPEEYVVKHWAPENFWMWIPLMCFPLVTLVGLTVVYMGEPGDLPYTISRVHSDAYIPMDHVSPMVFASMFSILAGGSLGPEAPLVAICGALGGFVSRRIFRQSSTNVVRKHTFMGMAGALAAFFGVPLGGSLFALEVCSRFGVEYFEHLIESIFCGEICLMVFRSLSGLPIKPIWDLTSMLDPKIIECDPVHVLLGCFIGLYGALVAYVFASFHWKNMAMFGRLNLLDNSRAVYRGWLGCCFIVIISLLVPHSAFWGEEEIQVVATMGPAKDLPNIWPTTGLIGFEMDTPLKVLIMGFSKLVAVSFTVAGGLRGGYIFPLMCAGCAFGRFLYFFLPDSIPLQVVVLCTAAALNVAITRTSLATTLIMSFLAGEPMALPPLLMSSLVSLFATSYMPFIKSQITRSDIDHSLFHAEHNVDVNSVFSDADTEVSQDDLSD